MENTPKTDTEIIELLAREVMGWIVIDQHTPLRLAEPHGGYIIDGTPKRHVRGICFERWNPLDSIADAWMIVDRVLAILDQAHKTANVSVHRHSNPYPRQNAGHWVANIEVLYEDEAPPWGTIGNGIDASPCRAICACVIEASDSLSAIRNQSAKEK